MKKSFAKIISTLLSLIMVITAVPPVAYAAGEVNINLIINNGEDIAAALDEQYADKKAENDTSGTIYRINVPAGSYTAGQQIKLYSNTYLNLNGVTVTHTDSNSVMFRLGKLKDWENSGGHPGYSGFSNIHIEGGTFDGNGLEQAIMRFGHSSKISVSGATFKNVRNAHMIEAGACDGVTIDGCTFSDFNGDWGSNTNYEALQFDVTDPKGEHFGAYPPADDETPCQNVTVTNCVFRNLQRGLGTHTGVVNTYCDNMVIENNTFENITGYAVIATNYTNSSINNNNFINCGSGIWFRTVEIQHSNFYSSKKHSNDRSVYQNLNSQINGNTISVNPGYITTYKNVHYAIKLEGEKLAAANKNTPAGDFRCSGVTVSSNTVNLNCTGYGIWLSGAIKNNVTGNKIYASITQNGKGGTGDGIRIQDSQSNTVKSNTIKNNTKKGKDSNMCGIVLCNNSKSNKLDSNTISKVKKDGISMRGGSSNVCNKNKISNSGRNGIALYKAKKTTITSNTIKKSKKYGIYTSLSKKKSIKKDKKNKISKSGKRARSWKKK